MPKRLHRPSGTTRLVFSMPASGVGIFAVPAGVAIVIPVVVFPLVPAPTEDDPNAMAEDETRTVDISDRQDLLDAHVAELLAKNPTWSHLGNTDQSQLPPSRAERRRWIWQGGRVVVGPP